jgi:sialic acid synthase SpsE
MSRIILDFGSGNTCKNDYAYIKRMIDELKAVDTGKHEVIIKWQLFDKAGENKPLEKQCFRLAYYYAQQHGYKTTASVFDMNSLKYLLGFDIPFVKIANNRSLDYLIGEVPRKIPVYVSVGDYNPELEEFECLYCISEYPATIEKYETQFHDHTLRRAVSDHTIGLELFNKYHPAIWEKHYKLEDSTGLDAGDFAITPAMLRGVL